LRANGGKVKAFCSPSGELSRTTEGVHDAGGERR
jgi:hypothetical protein